MGLVHHYVRYVEYGGVCIEKLCLKAFRRQVKELEITVCSIVQGQFHFPAVHAGMHRYGFDAPGLKVAHLVLHKGDKRSDNKRYPLLHHGRHLETYGLAAARREYCKDVPPFGGLLYNFFLHGPEAVISPICL